MTPIYTTLTRRHDGNHVFRDLAPDAETHRVNLAIIGSEQDPPLSPDEVERAVRAILYPAEGETQA